MTTLLSTPLALGALALAGVASWSFAEYVLHRFAFHELRGKGKGSREHLRHHAGLDHTTGTTALSWAGVWVVGAFLFAPVGWLLHGVAGGLALGLGWVAGFYTYEYLHWAAHRKPPRGSYTRWVRRSHFHHHFHAPLKNHGVTTPFWDLVFGTYEPPARIRVPRRMAVASVGWLVDDEGRVLPEFADDYDVRGRVERSAEDVRRDTAEAFANVAPTT